MYVQEQWLCSVEDDSHNLIDLSDLIKTSGYYEATSVVGSTNAAYYINICRPLVAIPNSLCPASAAACSVLGTGTAQVCLSPCVNIALANFDMLQYL